MLRLTGLRAAAATVLAVGMTVLTLGACTAGGAAPYPVNYSFTAAIAYTLTHYGQPPRGAEQLGLQADRCPPGSGGAGARHLRQHDRFVGGALPAPGECRLLRLRAELRRLLAR